MSTAPILAEPLQVAAALQDLAHAATEAQQIGEARFLVLPPHYALHEVTDQVEKADAEPRRERGTVTLKSIDSLLAVLKDHDRADLACVYADPDTLQIVAVLNDHRHDTPGWRDWRVQYRAELTPEAKRWLENNGAARAKDQTAFAEFLEDNIADIQEPDAQDLLTVATTIQATTGIEFKSGRRLQDGQVQLQYVENIDAKAGANGALTIPKTFTLGLRLFKNGDGYKMTARLKYRLNGGSVKFWYELDRPERALEDAFDGYVQRLRAESGYLVVLGTAG